MKKLLLVFPVFVYTMVYAQAPEGFNYQAVARDLTGAEMQNTSLSVEVDRTQ